MVGLRVRATNRFATGPPGRTRSIKNVDSAPRIGCSPPAGESRAKNKTRPRPDAPNPHQYCSRRPIPPILITWPWMVAEVNARVLADFLDYLRIEKGLAGLTISAYRTDLNQFREFLEKRKRAFLAARRSDVREFLQQLFSHGVDGRSVGRKLSALRHLYRCLLLDKRIDSDPTLNIESPRQWKVLPKSLAQDEIATTLAAPMKSLSESRKNRKDSEALASRDRAMLELLYA